MPEDVHAHDHHENDARHQTPQPADQTAEGFEGFAPASVDPAAALQRAATSPPPAVNPNDILSLQRIAGNQAVQRLIAQRKTSGSIIQAKLSVNPPGDKYEQEADQMASKVMGKIGASSAASVQRQEEEEEEELQTKTTGSIQRQTEEEEEELQTNAAEPIQRAETGSVPEADSGIEDTINSAKGSGNPLPESVRGQMEQGFGANFSGVRIHTGSEAHGLNQSLQAKAFTTGQNIFFKSGEYSPDSSSGQQLLAHELTHVVQQGGASSARHVQKMYVVSESGTNRPLN